MKIFDAHCDVLYQMWLNKEISFQNSDLLHTNLQKMKQSGGKVQAFAIYIPEQVPFEERFRVALEMIDIFYQDIITRYPDIKHVKHQNDVLALKDHEIGALLTLEGCDAIGHDVIKLKTLLRLGVSSVGLTWNYANAVADGILETRGAGLSEFGRGVVRELNTADVWTDVSHLSWNGFWDVMELADHPIASHSNAKALCDHPRNLTDEQIKAIIARDGMIGVTFVPSFLNASGTAEISDVIKHVDHMLALGAERNLGFGSDFDGITTTVDGLGGFQQYPDLIDALLNYYSEGLVRRIAFENYLAHLPG